MLLGYSGSTSSRLWCVFCLLLCGQLLGLITFTGGWLKYSNTSSTNVTCCIYIDGHTHLLVTWRHLPSAHVSVGHRQPPLHTHTRTPAGCDDPTAKTDGYFREVRVVLSDDLFLDMISSVSGIKSSLKYDRPRETNHTYNTRGMPFRLYLNLFNTAVLRIVFKRTGINKH